VTPLNIYTCSVFARSHICTRTEFCWNNLFLIEKHGIAGVRFLTSWMPLLWKHMDEWQCCLVVYLWYSERSVWMCRDAVCLARVRLSPSDPVLHKLFTSWAVHLSKDGNYELAAKWLVILSTHRLTRGIAVICNTAMPSCTPVWMVTCPKDLIIWFRNDWKLALVVISSLVDDPTIQ